MKRGLVLTGAFLLLGSVSGCGGESHDKLVEEMINAINRANQALVKIRDAKDKEAEARIQKDEIRKAGEELRDLKSRAENLRDPLDPEEKERLAEKYQKRFNEAVNEASKTWDELKKNEKVRDILKDTLANFGLVR